MNNCIGITYRKISKNNGRITSPNRKELHKQVLTLHKKMKKGDNGLVTEYSIESDGYRNRYHTHMMVHYSDKQNLFNSLQKFVKGTTWDMKYVGLDQIECCYGEYGEVDINYIYDQKGYRDYLNKDQSVKTLI